jgi:hypothetical protein
MRILAEPAQFKWFQKPKLSVYFAFKVQDDLSRLSHGRELNRLQEFSPVASKGLEEIAVACVGGHCEALLSLSPRDIVILFLHNILLNVLLQLAK